MAGQPTMRRGQQTFCEGDRDGGLSQIEEAGPRRATYVMSASEDRRP